MVKKKFTLEEIRQRQDLLRLDLDKKQRAMRTALDTMRTPPQRSAGFVQRFASHAQSTAYVIDAAILGFKLYRLLRGGKRKTACGFRRR